MNERAFIVSLLRKYMKGIEPYLSHGEGSIRLAGGPCAQYDEQIAGMECFARLFYGVWPAVYGGESMPELIEYFNKGVISGTEPSCQFYWGDFSGADQREVEMIPLVLMLYFNRKQTWDTYTMKQKEKISEWFYQVNSGEIYCSNWLFFRVLVNTVLKKLDTKYSNEKIQETLEKVESLYVGSGWYRDGSSQAGDYYIPFAFHFYSLLYTVLEPENPVCRTYRMRACEFARQFIYWYASDGSCVPYGRSLTYRFAQCAFWAALVFADVWPFEKGVVKGIIIRHLQWWAAQPICDNGGILSVGYAYPNLLMSENYNAWGSPYWAFKTFLILAIGKADPFWNEKILPLPQLDNVVYQKIMNYSVAAGVNRSQTVLFANHNCKCDTLDHYEDKYMKFAYSTLFGFSVRKSIYGFEASGADCILSVSKDSRTFFPRGEILGEKIENNILYSEWAPCSGVYVRSYIIPGCPWHVRIHVIDSKSKIIVRDSGFSIQDDKLEISRQPVEALCTSSTSASGILCLLGAGSACVCDNTPNINLLHPKTKMPYIQWILPTGRFVVGTAVYGAPDADFFHKKPTMMRNHDIIKVELNGKEYQISTRTKLAPKILQDRLLLAIRRYIRLYKGI